MISYISPKLPRNAIVRLFSPGSKDSRGQNRLSSHSVDRQARNYDTECSNNHPSLYLSISISIPHYIYVVSPSLFIQLLSKSKLKIVICHTFWISCSLSVAEFSSVFQIFISLALIFILSLVS